MIFLTRELLLTRLDEFEQLVNTFKQRPLEFIPACSVWLTNLEQDLGRLRHPQKSMASVARGRVAVLQQGHVESERNSLKQSRRKQAAAQAMQIAAESELVIREAILEVDHRTAVWREKMVQFVAVATARAPLPLPATEPRDKWLHDAWRSLQISAETINMFNYLNTALSAAERRHLFDEIVRNVESQVLTDAQLNDFQLEHEGSEIS